ncbi:VWA domain-containing protein [Photobacterium sanctipauli]|uniref:VWA domain-containing protein n=1 Tax=Photobacterium sanctipauli TaxID=1342794 RepID=A0A2T3N996_9GAMM|nr:VWA domain-containing protein [Photobacterium sanctipauli]PSW09993.1 VWA domain-containing protein [Photobacterium sanctipauli]
MFDSLFWQQLWTSFHFLRPLWLLAFIPLVIIVRARWRQDDENQWQRVLPDHLRKALTVGDSGWKHQLPLKVLTMVMSLAIITCAGPSWQRESSPFGEDKAAMLVVLDVSESMLDTDLAPSRLARAKQKIQDLLDLRQGGSTGLTVYSGSAHVAMPPTQDTAVFNPFLAAVEPSIMPVAGKSAQSILPLISEQLDDDKPSSVLLVTDGVTPKAIQEFEHYFSASPHQLLVLGVGNADVVSQYPYDVRGLKTLASKTKGKFVSATVDESDVKQLNRYVERHMQFNNESTMPWKDMGYYLLIPILLIMLLWFRKGWLVQWCVVGVVSLPLIFAPGVEAKTVHVMANETAQVREITLTERVGQMWMDLWLTPDQQGQYYFNQKEYDKAAQHYANPLYRGMAYYYAANYKLAYSAFVQAETEQGLLYAGNALARQREYLAARDLYFQLAEQAKSDAIRAEAKHNYDVLKGIVDEINRVSESQSGTTDGPEESFELGDDQPRTAEGAEEQVDASMMVRKTLNANEILGSEELADKWLRRVEADPKYFLQAKFQLQNIHNNSSKNRGE